MTTPNPSTAAPVGGKLTSGVRRNRSSSNFPDFEQKRREQARDESRWALGLRSTHPSYTRTNSDKNPGVVHNSNRSRQDAQAVGESE